MAEQPGRFAGLSSWSDFALDVVLAQELDEPWRSAVKDVAHLEDLENGLEAGL